MMMKEEDGNTHTELRRHDRTHNNAVRLQAAARRFIPNILRSQTQRLHGQMTRTRAVAAECTLIAVTSTSGATLSAVRVSGHLVYSQCEATKEGKVTIPPRSTMLDSQERGCSLIHWQAERLMDDMARTSTTLLGAHFTESTWLRVHRCEPFSVHSLPNRLLQ